MFKEKIDIYFFCADALELHCTPVINAQNFCMNDVKKNHTFSAIFIQYVAARLLFHRKVWRDKSHIISW